MSSVQMCMSNVGTVGDWGWKSELVSVQIYFGLLEDCFPLGIGCKEDKTVSSIPSPFDYEYYDFGWC